MAGVLSLGSHIWQNECNAMREIDKRELQNAIQEYQRTTKLFELPPEEITDVMIEEHLKALGNLERLFQDANEEVIDEPILRPGR